MQLLQEYGHPSSEATLASINQDLFELAIDHAIHDPDLSLLKLAIAYVNEGIRISGTDTGMAPPDLAAFGTFLDRTKSSLGIEAPRDNTADFLRAANRRQIPWIRLTDGVYQFGWGSKARRLLSTHTDRTSIVAQQMAKSKIATHQVLAAAGVPVPLQGVAYAESKSLELAERFGLPVVVKPANQDLGRGVSTRLTTLQEVRSAYKTASAYGGAVLVEQHVEGDDHRLLVVDGRLLAAVQRLPGGVTGDGNQTLSQLLVALNADPRRGAGMKGMVRIDLDEEALEMLRRQGLTAQSIPQAGQWVVLRQVPIPSRGGTTVAVSERVHPDNRRLAERATRLIGLDMAGIDFVTPDISKSWREVGGAIIEVNSQPLLTSVMLAHPQRDLCGEILDGMFRGDAGRIPVTAIVGSEGQSAVCDLLHRLLCSTGVVAATATRHGVVVGDALESWQSASGCAARDALLTDPLVESAVMELTAAGLLSEGHPCDRYAVGALISVLPKVQAQLTPDFAARMMAEVLERATDAVVINADDALCLSMLRHAQTRRHIFFSSVQGHAAVQDHILQGGEAVCLTRDGVVLFAAGQQTCVLPHAELPEDEQQNSSPSDLGINPILCAIALAHALGLDVPQIRKGLSCKVAGSALT